jgi:hypothetical protein
MARSGGAEAVAQAARIIGGDNVRDEAENGSAKELAERLALALVAE